MNPRQRIAAAVACAATLGLIGPTQAQDMGKEKGGKEKCFGVAKAGSNDCANLSGTHSCAGQSKADMRPDEWKYVPAGTCKDMKGMTAEEAKAKAKSTAEKT